MHAQLLGNNTHEIKDCTNFNTGYFMLIFRFLRRQCTKAEKLTDKSRNGMAGSLRDVVDLAGNGRGCKRGGRLTVTVTPVH